MRTTSTPQHATQSRTQTHSSTQTHTHTHHTQARRNTPQTGNVQIIKTEKLSLDEAGQLLTTTSDGNYCKLRKHKCQQQPTA